MLDEYQSLTREQDPYYGLVKYKKRRNLDHYFKGITSEVGGLLSACGYRDKIEKCGDVFWYIARFCDEFDRFSFAELYHNRVVVTSGSVPSITLLGLSRLANQLSLWEIKGDGDVDTRITREDEFLFGLVSILSACLSYVQCESQDMGVIYGDAGLLEDIIESNVRKALIQTPRKVIHGQTEDA